MIFGFAARKAMPWLIGAGLMGGGWLYHNWQTGKLEADLADAEARTVVLTEKVASWQAHAESLQERIELERRERRRAEVAVRNLLLEIEAEEKATDELIVQVETAPDEDDAPVAPVLRQALEGLSP